MNPAHHQLFDELNTLHKSAQGTQENLSSFSLTLSNKSKAFGDTQIKEMGYSLVYGDSYIATDGHGYKVDKVSLYRQYMRQQWQPGSKLEYAFLLAASKFSITATILYLSCLSTGVKADINELRKLQKTFVDLCSTGINTLKSIYELGVTYTDSNFNYGNKSIVRRHFSDFLQDDNFQLRCLAPQAMSAYQPRSMFGRAPQINFHDLFPESKEEGEKKVKAVVNEITKIVLLRYPFFITFPELDAYIPDICRRENIEGLFPNQMPGRITLPNVLNGKAIGFSDTALGNLSLIEEVTLAIAFDNVDLLKELLTGYEKEKGEDARNEFVRDNALLGFAAVNGRIQSIKLLLQLSANIEQKFTITFVADNSNQYSAEAIAWLKGSPVFDHYKDKYANSTLELTPLGLVLLAAPVLSQNQAKQGIQQLLTARADHNAKVARSWSETHGYYDNQQTRTKTEHIKLFDFDTTGLLSKIVNEQRNSRNDRGGPKRPVMHNYPGSGASSSKAATNQSGLQERVVTLEAEVLGLRVIINDLQKRLSVVEKPHKPRKP